jgi:hypothetical protein
MNSGTPAHGASLASYDSRSLGPLFAVSDEGSAGAAVLAAAYASAKARAFPDIDPLTLGVILDGERMTSAGEVPIGPDEYAALSAAAAGRLLLTTNVGVRVNARYSQPLPEFAIPDGNADAPWVDRVCAAFTPFLETPDRRPRPLTVRLLLRSGHTLSALEGAVASLESARRAGRIGPADLHRLSLLLVFASRIEGAAQLREITDVIAAAARIGVSEVAVDGELRAAARPRVSLPSLLNVLEVGDAASLLREAKARRVHLTYRYQLDVQTAARTIWTGLDAARTHGFAAGKYGMVPLALAEQRTVIELVGRWTRGWTAIPAFYVDTPLVTDDDVIDPSRPVDAACTWLDTAGAAGASLVLFDCPDRITPRRLLRQAASSADDPGVLTLDDVDRILARARDLRMEILWSGGITAPQAFELAKRRVHGIFSTSSTARKIAVTAPFQDDPRLAAENEPTEIGVRRMHGIVQGGFLGAAVQASDGALASEIDGLTQKLLAAEGDAAAMERALAALNERLLPAWRTVRQEGGRWSPAGEAESAPAPVSPDAVRVFRGRKREELSHDVFLEKLGTVFMPITVQLQRLYGLTAYLPAVLPTDHPAGLPDEIALVFYRTQEAYHFAKRCVGGRAYSQLHDLVFDMPKSPSSFPAAFAGEVQLDQAYHLLPGQVDWQGGRSRVYVGTRNTTLAPEAFRAEIAARAAGLRKTPAVDAVILCATPDWLVCWTHGPGDLPSAVFAEVTAAVLDREARALVVSPDLSVPYDGLQLSPAGDFLNLHFPRV